MKKIALEEVRFDVLLATGRDMPVLAAGEPEDFNMMTIGWATYGTLWSQPVTTVYVRHSRYTHEFMAKNKRFSVTFLEDGHKDLLLGKLGRQSGRDIDKMHDSGLTVSFSDGAPVFAEGKLTLICEQVYMGEITEDQFLDPALCQRHYSDHDMHSFYVGRVIAAYEGE